MSSVQLSCHDQDLPTLEDDDRLSIRSQSDGRCLASRRRAHRAPTAMSHSLSFNVRTSTWGSDSHGLFDYESRNSHHKAFKCKGTRDAYQMIRIDNDMHLVDELVASRLLKQNPAAVSLCSIIWRDDSYYLASPTDKSTSAPSADLWLVLRSLTDHSIRLIVGDVIKLGRFQLQLRDVFLPESPLPTPPVPTSHRRRRIFLPYGSRRVISAPQSSVGSSDSSRRSSPTIRRHDSPAPDPSGVSSLRSSGRGGGWPSATSPIGSSVSRPGQSLSDGVTSESESQRPRDKCETSASGDFSGRPVSSNCEAAGDRGMQTRQTSGGAGVCRVCLCEEEQPADDPLISPCGCSGSMKDIHLNCLRTWMQGRLNITSNETVVGFFWRSLECELCLMPYPTNVSITSAPYIATHPTSVGAGGEVFVELCEIPKPDLPYIILEPLTATPTTTSGGLYYLSLAHSRMARLGRGHDVDVRLSDISISRLHATIRWHHPPPFVSREPLDDKDAGPSIVLEDANAKFGTLLKIDKPIRLEAGRDVCIQVGRSILYFTSKRKWRFLPACFRPPPLDDITCQSSLRSRNSTTAMANP